MQKVLFYYDCMDKMLQQLTKEPKAEFFSPVDLAKKCGLDLTSPVVHLLCNKMVKDELVERFKEDRFALSEESIFFIEEGGYRKQHELTVAAERIKNSREKRLSNGTVFLAIGTFLLVAWEIYRALFLECH